MSNQEMGKQTSRGYGVRDDWGKTFQDYYKTKNGDECDYFRYTTDMFVNQDEIVFNENIRGMRNPIKFQVNQYSV